MSFDLDAFVLGLCLESGIPPEHVSAVVHRARMAREARDDYYGRRRSSAMAKSLRHRPKAHDRDLGRHVVACALTDLARGALERRLGKLDWK